MTRDPHCAGCQRRIWFRLIEKRYLVSGIILFFHHRCAASYEKGQRDKYPFKVWED